ncbi:MAG: DnaJ domain-containing protein [Myxococcales bacterium]
MGETRIPKLAARSGGTAGLSLDVLDVLLLSVLDGKKGVSELASLLATAEPELETSLRRLESSGLIAFSDPLPEEPLDLEPDRRTRIDSLYAKMRDLDHYALLGVPRGGDKKAVKRAYYDLAAFLHPDRFFRKRLGTYKAKMEALFERVTAAHDTLTDKDKRAEYDAYLAESDRSHGIESLLEDALAEAKKAEAAIEKAAADTSESAAVPSAPAPRVPTAPVDDAVRRQMLARRLMGGRAPSRPAPPPSSPMTTADAMESLKRRYQERLRAARQAQARKYADIAGEAKDPVAAANALRVAATLAPDDPEIQRKSEEAQEAAGTVLAESYRKQAVYEEKNGQWPEAAKSWRLVVRGRPNDAMACERAANAILKAEGSLHDASTLGQRAVALEPTNAAFRVTLANVYVAAGLSLNARRELDAAAQLAPDDATVQALRKRAGESS